MTRHGKIAGAFIITMLIFLFIGQAQAISFGTDPDAVDKAAQSVLMLEVYDDEDKPICTGSGFVAFDNFTLVTNYHVMDGAAYIMATSDAGNQYRITNVIATDPRKDIAILEFFSPTDLEPLRMNVTTELRRVEPVVAIGSPIGIRNTVSTGTISAIYEEYGVDYIQFTAPISHGSSGGALFNDNGEVIGITSATYNDSQNMNLAVYIGEVVELYNMNSGNQRIKMDKYSITPMPTPIPTPRPTPSPTPRPNIIPTPRLASIHKQSLAAPSNVKGTSSVAGITITWDVVPNAEKYHVFRSTYAGAYSEVEKTAANRYIDNLSDEPGIYSYKIYSSDGVAVSAEYSLLNVTSYYQFSDELSVPGKFKAKASGTAVTLTWSKDKNAKEYAIYRAATPSGTFEKLTTVTAAKCVDKNVIKGSTYYYKIRSIDGTNVSEISESIKAVMPKPTATPKPTKTPKPTATPRPPKYVLFVYGGAECELYQGHWRINPQVVNIDTNNAIEAFDLTFCCTNVYDEELIKRKGTKDYYVTFTFNKTVQPEDFAYAGSVLLDGFSDVKYIYAAVTKYKLKDGKTIKIPEKDRYWIKITAK